MDKFDSIEKGHGGIGNNSANRLMMTCGNRFSKHGLTMLEEQAEADSRQGNIEAT